MYQGYKLTETKQIPETVKIKPASRPRYNAGIFFEAVVAAARISAKHNVEVFVSPTYYGLTIGYEKPISGNFMTIKGRTVKTYERIFQ